MYMHHLLTHQSLKIRPPDNSMGACAQRLQRPPSSTVPRYVTVL